MKKPFAKKRREPGRQKIELEEFRKRYYALINAFDGFIYMCFQNYRIEFMNDQLIRRTGYDATGELCYRALHDRDSVCPWCVNEKVFRGETVRWEVQSPKDNRWFYVMNAPIYRSDGSISKFAVILDITDRKQAEEKLQRDARKLEESNIALKVLLQQWKNDRREMETNVMANIKQLVLPYVEKIRTRNKSPEDMVYLNILETNLKDILSPFTHKMSAGQAGLTQKEILIADLIKDGKQDKDIAEILYLSIDTVKAHRRNIRKKLGITGKKVNLMAFLLSLNNSDFQ